MNIILRSDRLFITMGCHPTRCGQFETSPDGPDGYLKRLGEQIELNRSKVVALGECGLDYDRTKFCAPELQRKYFEKQLTLAAKYRLPLFLHCRNAFDDFWSIIERNSEAIAAAGGVVHSFDGTLEQAKRFIDFGLYIGINGCSLKTEEQLRCVAQLPAERILIETDCPWCGIRKSHAGAKLYRTQFPVVKKKEKWTADSLIDGRYEPAQIVQVLEVLAAIRQTEAADLANQIYKNTNDLFFASSSTS